MSATSSLTTTSPKLRMRRIAYPVTALGPGNRIALWVAGCSLDCKGCITPELQPPSSGRNIEIGQLLMHLTKLPGHFDGITLTGGEPFEQPRPLVELLRGLATLKPEWNTLIFSGYPFRHLLKMGMDCKNLLSQTDILIDGPFSESSPSQGKLTATTNQTVHYLSKRGEQLKSQCEHNNSRANLGFNSNQDDILIGILAPEVRAGLHTSLGILCNGNTDRAEVSHD